MNRREAIKIVGKTAGGLFVAKLISACKNVSGPSNPPPPDKLYDQVEFMYQRTLPIIYPKNTDPSEVIVYHQNYGFFPSTDWHSTGSNQWMCSARVWYERAGTWPFQASVVDHKVLSEFDELARWARIARTIFARIQGSVDWIELSNVLRGTGPGEWTSFFLSKDGIYVPKQIPGVN